MGTPLWQLGGWNCMSRMVGSDCSPVGDFLVPSTSAQRLLAPLFAHSPLLIWTTTSDPSSCSSSLCSPLPLDWASALPLGWDAGYCTSPTHLVQPQLAPDTKGATFPIPYSSGLQGRTLGSNTLRFIALRQFNGHGSHTW